MRWSVVLSTFFTVLSLQSLISFALVTTQNEGTLEKRVFGIGKGKDKDVKASSKTYRSNSFSHPHAYDFSGPSGVTRQSIPDGQRQSFFSKMFKGKKYDADHVYEAQMYHDTLRRQGTSHSQLPANLQDEARRIMNRPENMAPIPPSINRSKGQLVKWGLKGKSLRKSNGLARSYSLNSYPTSRHTAEELQQTFQRHGYGHQGPTFHDTLHNSMTHAGILTPGQPSPPNSPPHRSQSARQPSRHSTSPASQPVIPQHSYSTRQSARLRTSSVSQPPSQPVRVIPQRSSSTRQSTRIRGQTISHGFSPYQRSSSHASSSRLPQTGYPVVSQQHSSGHASTSRPPQTGPVIPQQLSRTRSSRQRP
ncbi:hypothetical protein APHAL10511_008605 [Amanita phalloides]|nr:hypothetical protein APHAL10511_008605 [Amanita phalloides]